MREPAYVLQDLLAGFAHNEADELRLEPGRPACYFKKGGENVESGDVLSANDRQKMIYSLLHEELRQELESNGRVETAFSLRNVASFRLEARLLSGELVGRVVIERAG